MVAHHLGTLLAVTSSIVTGECHMHAAWMLLTEATTPFINLRWWLEKSVRERRARERAARVSNFGRALNSNLEALLPRRRLSC